MHVVPVSAIHIVHDSDMHIVPGSAMYIVCVSDVHIVPVSAMYIVLVSDMHIVPVSDMHIVPVSAIRIVPLSVMHVRSQQLSLTLFTSNFQIAVDAVYQQVCSFVTCHMYSTVTSSFDIPNCPK
jgi:hypothetical protein